MYCALKAAEMHLKFMYQVTLGSIEKLPRKLRVGRFLQTRLVTTTPEGLYTSPTGCRYLIHLIRKAGDALTP